MVLADDRERRQAVDTLNLCPENVLKLVFLVLKRDFLNILLEYLWFAHCLTKYDVYLTYWHIEMLYCSIVFFKHIRLKKKDKKEERVSLYSFSVNGELLFMQGMNKQ